MSLGNTNVMSVANKIGTSSSHQTIFISHPLYADTHYPKSCDAISDNRVTSTTSWQGTRHYLPYPTGEFKGQIEYKGHIIEYKGQPSNWLTEISSLYCSLPYPHWHLDLRDKCNLKMRIPTKPTPELCTKLLAATSNVMKVCNTHWTHISLFLVKYFTAIT